MNKGPWLQLNEYSNKYKVSVSTLRRRIKSGDIEYQFEEGKYWLADKPVEKYARQKSVSSQAPVSVKPKPREASGSSVTREEVLEITRNMISEIKSAYVLVLQEKESAIIQAKKEIADLKTLCHTLESENERLKAESNAPLSGWFIDEDSNIEA